ncbi:MAG: GNAT family N-acetyltransferase [Clostridium sp.]|uniref:GNAT family N-acetyltransferase n=1 Tax=Clostridium culturomicium TaxID=1499683 RepID=UPI00058D2FC4|nr:GNAT family N-acetyltransferase [Clostridium culturomicium]MDU4891951.1 GNAT family N-acetyltransferase [Clostridium sp.]MDU7084579.1 GNAT family N-acetyltransferase [Clostridium sp.]
MRKLALRTATEEDAPMIAGLIYETEDNPDHVWGRGTKDIILNRIQWLVKSRTSRYSYLNIKVAELDGKICGAIVLLDSDEIAGLDFKTSLKLLTMIKGVKAKATFIKDLFKSRDLEEGGEKELYIANLATSSEVRGLGIGKELMNLAEKIAKEEGYKGCSLLAKDAKVMKFYERMNYVLEKEEKYFSQSLYRMAKAI